MIDSYDNASSALKAYSEGLKSISKNISNMNTPGYKRSDTVFSNLTGQNNSESVLEYSTVETDESQGELFGNNDPNSYTLLGSGFFGLESEQELLLDRSIRLNVNESTLYDESGLKLVTDYDSDDFELLRSDYVSTTQLQVSGIFNTTNSTFSKDKVILIDQNGEEAEVELKVNRIVKDGEELHFFQVLQEDQVLAESAVGNIQDLKTTFTLKSNSEILADLSLTLSANTQFISSGNTNVNIFNVDGRTSGVLTNFEIDVNGKVTYLYDNGESRDVGNLKLFDVPDMDTLKLAQNSMYLGDDSVFELNIKDVDVSILSGQFEGSNVDLTAEFSKMMLIQRGFQASSKMLSASDELLQTLMDSTK